MATPLPFAQGFYVSESLPISAQECVNFYPNIPQTGTVTQQSLFGTPGLVEIATAGINETNRGLHVFNSIPFAVNGENLYRIDRSFDAFGVPSFTAVQVNGATDLPGTERVQMADNGIAGGQMCIILPEETNQFNAYIFTTAGGLVQISDGSFDGPVSSVVYIDGFFLFTKTDGNKFFISDLRDGFSYLATDFADAEVDPDPIKAASVLRNELLIWGSQTMEPFQNIGGAGFPFLRIEGAVQDKGLDAINSLVAIDGNLAFIGGAVQEQAAIWITDGGKPQKLSTTAIDNQIRTYSDSVVTNAFAVTYSQSGALFAAFTFPGEETFVYESVSGLWHTRQSLSDNIPVNWRVSNIVEAYGELIVGDLFNNKFGIIDKDEFTEYTEHIHRRFVLPPLDNEGNPFFNNSIEAVGESGVGNTVGLGQDPTVLLSFSDDGGRTFSDSLPRSFGLKGDYKFRTIWNRLGRVARERMYRFDVSDPVKWVFFKIEANID